MLDDSTPSIFKSWATADFQTAMTTLAGLMAALVLADDLNRAYEENELTANPGDIIELDVTLAYVSGYTFIFTAFFCMWNAFVINFGGIPHWSAIICPAVTFLGALTLYFVEQGLYMSRRETLMEFVIAGSGAGALIIIYFALALSLPLKDDPDGQEVWANITDVVVTLAGFFAGTVLADDLNRSMETTGSGDLEIDLMFTLLSGYVALAVGIVGLANIFFLHKGVPHFMVSGLPAGGMLFSMCSYVAVQVLHMERRGRIFEGILSVGIPFGLLPLYAGLCFLPSQENIDEKEKEKFMDFQMTLIIVGGIVSGLILADDLNRAYESDGVVGGFELDIFIAYTAGYLPLAVTFMCMFNWFRMYKGIIPNNSALVFPLAITLLSFLCIPMLHGVQMVERESLMQFIIPCAVSAFFTITYFILLFVSPEKEEQEDEEN